MVVVWWVVLVGHGGCSVARVRAPASFHQVLPCTHLRGRPRRRGGVLKGLTRAGEVVVDHLPADPLVLSDAGEGEEMKSVAVLTHLRAHLRCAGAAGLSG